MSSKPAGFLSGVANAFGLTSSTNKYVVRVKTRDVKGAGTNNSVRASFATRDGKRTNEFHFDKWWSDDLERGVDDVYEFVEDCIGEIECMDLTMDCDSNAEDRWFCEVILVYYVKDGDKKPTVYPFPIHRWIKPGKTYEFDVYDCCLPQEDMTENARIQRKDELAANKIAYKYAVLNNGFPKTTASLPDQEVFSTDYQWDIAARKIKLMAEKKIQEIFGSSKWEKFEDMRALYVRTFDIPKGWYNWDCDFKFGDQRLNGVNTTQLKRCDAIPAKLPVTNEMVKSFLEGRTLEQAIHEKRIFIEDLAVLEHCPQKDGAKLCAPIGLFYATEEGALLPIAIQLFQKPAADNPIFLPSDPKYKWLLVKMFFNNADCSVHQSTTHLGFTHLVCESIASATSQSLSPSHPVYQILAPHFLYLLAINSRAIGKLLAPGEWIDQTMTMGVIGLSEIVKRLWKEWRMDCQGWYPADIENRGVDDKDILSTFYCRDDQLLLHGAIWDYVRDVLHVIYDRPEKLRDDYEVQDFARTLASEDGAGIKGVFGGGKFEDVEDLIKVVTTTIYIASVTHATANFGQYDEYGFPPVYPAKLFGDVPKDKSKITIEDVIACLPDKSTTLSIMVVTRILSEKSTQGLGDFEINYLYQPRLAEAVKRFQDNLKDIGDKIDKRNRKVKHPYPYLHPTQIPNAISI